MSIQGCGSVASNQGLKTLMFVMLSQELSTTEARTPFVPTLSRNTQLSLDVVHILVVPSLLVCSVCCSRLNPCTADLEKVAPCLPVFVCCGFLSRDRGSGTPEQGTESTSSLERKVQHFRVQGAPKTRKSKFHPLVFHAASHCPQDNRLRSQKGVLKPTGVLKVQGYTFKIAGQQTLASEIVGSEEYAMGMQHNAEVTEKCFQKFKM